jgi:predicted metal-dependent peptidase
MNESANLKQWRLLASQRVPAVAAILYACSYRNEPDLKWWAANGASAPTFCVNPATLEVVYNDEFAAKNTDDQNAFALAHEGGHVLCEHIKRRKRVMAREGEDFLLPLMIMAEEMAVNQMVMTLGKWSQIPIEGLIKCPAKYAQMSTEEIYADLKATTKVVKVSCKCFHDDGKEGDSATEMIKAQAINAGREVVKQSGLQPGTECGELREMAAFAAPLQSKPNFRDMLMRYLLSMNADCRQFDEATIYRRRAQMDGLCMPNISNRSQASRFCASIDNSGSVGEPEFALLKAILVEAAEQLGFDEIIVQHFTTQVMKTERYTDLRKLQTFKRQADGGTALEDCDAKAAQNKAVFNVIMTDGYVQWLDEYSVPTVIIRTAASTEPPPKVRNLVAEVLLTA